MSFRMKCVLWDIFYYSFVAVLCAPFFALLLGGMLLLNAYIEPMIPKMTPQEEWAVLARSLPVLIPGLILEMLCFWVWALWKQEKERAADEAQEV